MLTPEQLLEIRKRADAATPGPIKKVWVYSAGGDDGDSYAVVYLRKARNQDVPATQNDFELFSRANTDIPALLDHIERLNDKLKVATEALEEVKGCCAFDCETEGKHPACKVHEALARIQTKQE